MQSSQDRSDNLLKFVLVFSLLTQARCDYAVTGRGQEGSSLLQRPPSPKLPRAEPPSPNLSVVTLKAPSSTQALLLSSTNSSGIVASSSSDESAVPSPSATRSALDPCTPAMAMTVVLLTGMSLLWLLAFVVLCLGLRWRCRTSQKRCWYGGSQSGCSVESPSFRAIQSWAAASLPSSEKDPAGTFPDPVVQQRLPGMQGQYAELHEVALPYEIQGDSTPTQREELAGGSVV